jgi:hypothetical protein
MFHGDEGIDEYVLESGIYLPLDTPIWRLIGTIGELDTPISRHIGVQVAG